MWTCASTISMASGLRRVEAEALALALHVADRRRREVRRAHQGLGVAIALEETAPGGGRLLGVEVGPRRQVEIAHLERRVDQIAGHHRILAPAAEADREVVGRVAR